MANALGLDACRRRLCALSEPCRQTPKSSKAPSLSKTQNQGTHRVISGTLTIMGETFLLEQGRKEGWGRKKTAESLLKTRRRGNSEMEHWEFFPQKSEPGITRLARKDSVISFFAMHLS